jgi:hypothetical protein
MDNVNLTPGEIRRRKNISKKLRGRKLSPEHCQKIKASALERYRNGWNPNKGRKFRPEQYESRSAMMTGRKLSDATKQKLRLINLGKKPSPEAIEKMRRTKITLNLKGPKSPVWQGGQDGWFHKYARIIWEENHGIQIPGGYYIHHVDGNCRNNDPANLQLVTPLEHSRIHPYDPKCRIYKRKSDIIKT